MELIELVKNIVDLNYNDLINSLSQKKEIIKTEEELAYKHNFCNTLHYMYYNLKKDKNLFLDTFGEIINLFHNYKIICTENTNISYYIRSFDYYNGNLDIDTLKIIDININDIMNIIENSEFLTNNIHVSDNVTLKVNVQDLLNRNSERMYQNEDYIEASNVVYDGIEPSMESTNFNLFVVRDNRIYLNESKNIIDENRNNSISNTEKTVILFAKRFRFLYKNFYIIHHIKYDE